MKRGKKAIGELFNFEGFSFYEISIENAVIIELKKRRKTGTCPICDKTKRKVIEAIERTIRDDNYSREKCFIILIVYRIVCKKCCYRGMEKLDLILPGERFTKRFSDQIFELCEKMTLKDVAKHSMINWRTAKKIDKKRLQSTYKNLDEVNPTRIGVDEIAYQKGHKYLTIVRDLDEGVIWVGIGRKKEVLDEFFKELGKEKSSNITIAVMDMWRPYIASVKENTNAKIVFDKFHLSKIINGAMDKIRKREFRNANPEERKLMKKKRFIILSREGNLKRGERVTLNELMNKNKTLYKAYLLKEEALSILQRKQKNVAVKRFENWKKNVLKSEFEEFKKALKTLEAHWYGIENYFECKVTNGGSEGYNNKINIIKRRAYGFKDIEYFKLKILQSCS